MKKLSVLFLSACAVSMFVASNAGANQPANTNNPINAGALANNGGIISQFQSTVKGTFKVPAALMTSIPGIECADISVSAQSQDMKPVPPGGLFMSPKWTRHTVASGNWASGVCSYSLNVVPGSNFAMTVDGAMPASGGPKCFMLGIISSPQQVGYFKVAMGAVKEQDFTVTGGYCEVNPPG